MLRDVFKIDLDKIINWPVQDFSGLFEYIRGHWQYADCGYFEHPTEHRYILHTAGWSGNEEIVNALMENHIFWTYHWQKSKRGGHYWFKNRLRGKK